MMTLKTYERTPHVTAPRVWTDDDSTDFELPHDVTREIASLTSAFSRDPGRAVAVLELLARSPRPMSRIRLGEELGIPAAALGRTITLLDEHGFVTWTRRFGVGLGVRFVNGEHLSGHIQSTFLNLVQPHLDMLVREHGGTVFVGMRAGSAMMFPLSVGPDATTMLTPDPTCIHVADHATTQPWSHASLSAAAPIQGVWSVACEDGFATLASRITLAHSAACIGLRIETSCTSDFRIPGHALVASANQLTSALRRQFPQ